MNLDLAGNEKAKLLAPYVDAAGIRLFPQNPSGDTTLLRWWIWLNSSGEINDLIAPDAQGIDSFIEIFRYPTHMLCTLDSSNELTQAHWLKPVSGRKDELDVFNGVWCHPSLRGTRQQLQFTYLTYRLAFCFCRAIIGTTWQTKLIAEHAKMGYDVVGMLPNFMGHEYFYFVRLTEEKFVNSKAGKAGERLIQGRK